MAVDAAAEAGRLLASWRGDGRPEVVQTKSSPTDVVTEMDRRSEALITGRIRAVRLATPSSARKAARPPVTRAP